MLSAITPVLLTFNEAPNIARTLRQLAWANDIVVVDSGSTDETLSILAQHPCVRVFHRALDRHPAQWAYATHETAIRTPWILRLDADYYVTDELIGEIGTLNPEAPACGYWIDFDYALFGRKLRASAYPGKPALLRQGCYSITDEGHTEGWTVDGPVARLRSRIVHDDRKDMRQWTMAQARYMTIERDKLCSRRKGVRDWLRMHPPLMPAAVFFYCLFAKGLVFSGRAGIAYTLQRCVAEGLLSVYLIEEQFLRADADSAATGSTLPPAEMRALIDR